MQIFNPYPALDGSHKHLTFRMSRVLQRLHRNEIITARVSEAGRNTHVRKLSVSDFSPYQFVTCIRFPLVLTLHVLCAHWSQALIQHRMVWSHARIPRGAVSNQQMSSWVIVPGSWHEHHGMNREGSCSRQPFCCRLIIGWLVSAKPSAHVPTAWLNECELRNYSCE